jgi:hypothetical protein
MAKKAVPPGTFMVYINSVWTPLKETIGFGDYFRDARFRAILPLIKKGEVHRFKGRAFKVQK